MGELEYNTFPYVYCFWDYWRTVMVCLKAQKMFENILVCSLLVATAILANADSVSYVAYGAAIQKVNNKHLCPLTNTLNYYFLTFLSRLFFRNFAKPQTAKPISFSFISLYIPQKMRSSIIGALTQTSQLFVHLKTTCLIHCYARVNQAFFCPLKRVKNCKPTFIFML